MRPPSAPRSVPSNLLHEKDGSRIDHKRYCVKEDREVPWDEIVKGYEYAKGKYVVLTDDDFDKARSPATEEALEQSRRAGRRPPVKMEGRRASRGGRAARQRKAA